MPHRRGFSFAEVMFAVVILGIGFIMVAAIFPIATEQTRSTADEAAAAMVARAAMATIQSATHTDDYPNDAAMTNITRGFYDASPQLWNQVASSTINTTDPRYAWVPFFSQLDSMGTLRITVLVLRRWNHGVYTSDDTSETVTKPGDLLPRGISVSRVTHQADGSDLIVIGRDSAGMYNCIAPGCFVIIRSCPGDLDEAGRIFRIGQYQSETSDTVSWLLDAREPLIAGETCEGASAAVIGRDYKDLSNLKAGFDGPAQDVGVYTTYMRPG